MSPQISPKQLITSTKAERYLQELDEHVEDAGSHQAVGVPDELVAVFNTYARPRRNLKLAIIFSIAIYVLISVTFFSHGELWDNNHNYPNPTLADRYPWMTLTLFLPGLCFYLPVAALILIPIYGLLNLFGLNDGFALNDLFDAYFFLVPFLASAFWSGLATLILFPPRWLRRLVRRKQRYDD